MDWQVFASCVTMIARGLPLTVMLLLWAVPLSLLLALILVVMRRSSCRPAAFLARCYGAFFRGTPLLVQLYLAYNGTGSIAFVKGNAVLWWLFSDGFRTAVLVITLNSAAYICEILRGGFAALPKETREAAAALGMAPLLALRRIELPLVLRHALPAYGNELILLVKGTSLASTIAVAEMMSYTKRLFSNTLAPLEVFLACACFYLAINFILTAIVRIAEHWLMRYRRQ